jgi:hypothetical protein
MPSKNKSYTDLPRKNVKDMSSADLTQLRTLLDHYINKPTDNPVTEHKDAGNDMSLMIHDDGFLAWHQHFVAKAEHWFVLNGGERFVPLPYWNPAGSIPTQLDKNNKNVNMPLPQNLSSTALKKIASYIVLNNRILPYHNNVHDNLDGQMPNPETSPSDPIFWPFHSFLLAVYEKWRNLKK